MNFGDLWQEHRKYLTAVLAGAVSVLVVHIVLSSIYEGRIAKANGKFDRARQESAKALPANADLSKVKRDREALEAQFDALRAALHRVPAESMTLASGVADPDLHYNAQLDRIRTTTLELCALRNIDVDQRLGLPENFPASRTEIEHYLRGLDAVEQFVRECLEAEQIVEGGVARVVNAQIEKPAKAKAGAAAGQRPFLTPLTIKATAVGHPRAIDELLRSFAGAPGGTAVANGRRLVLQEATVRSLDAGPGSANRDRRGLDPLDVRRVELAATMTVLDIDPQGRL